MSALDVRLIIVGAHSKLELAPYVTAKGAGTFTDAGSSIGGATLEEKVEHHLVEIDQRLGAVMAVPSKREVEVKVKLAQGELDNLRLALGIPSAGLTGTPPNLTLRSDLSRGELYFQARLTGKGLGTTGVRTWTGWRSYAKALAAIPFKKDAEQSYELTLGVCEETTGSGTDSWLMVDA